MRLGLEQGRVIGCLIEKQLTTPQQYPLTLNALVSACNQSSNRDPVVSYDDPLVQRTLASLKEENLVRFVYPSSGRSATRYRQVIDQSLRLEEPALAILAVLLLRGPQTVGELRTRTERMTAFETLSAVNEQLEGMATRDEPFVLRLPRRPGQKEERWVQLLMDVPGSAPDGVGGPGAGTAVHRAFGPAATSEPFADPDAFAGTAERDPSVAPAQASVDLAGAIEALRDEVAALKAAVAELQERLSL